MSTDSIARQPAGTPAGGRFAMTTRQEAGYVLVTNPPGPETDAKEAVTEAVLEEYPDAVSWRVGTDEYGDGYFYDESFIEVTLRDETTASVDLTGTAAADALTELADHERVGRYSKLDVTIPTEPPGGWPAEPPASLTAPAAAGLVSVAHRSGAVVNVYVGDDGAIVVDYDTSALPAGQRVRVNVNDGVVYDGDPEVEGNLQAPTAPDLET